MFLTPSQKCLSWDDWSVKLKKWRQIVELLLNAAADGDDDSDDDDKDANANDNSDFRIICFFS